MASEAVQTGSVPDSESQTCEVCGQHQIADLAPIEIDGQFWPNVPACEECAPARSAYPAIAERLGEHYPVGYVVDAMGLTLREVWTAFGAREAFWQARWRAKRALGL